MAAPTGSLMDYDLEMAPIDRLCKILGPGQMVTLKEAEQWLGIQLSEEERTKYAERLGKVAQELLGLIDGKIYEKETLRRHGAYLYPQLPRIAIKDDAVDITVASLQKRFGVQHEGKITFGAMNPSVATQITRALSLPRVSPAWVLALAQPFGGRRSEVMKKVTENLQEFNRQGRGRFEVAQVQHGVYAALMEALKPIGSSKRGEDQGGQRLTSSPMERRQIWVNRGVDRTSKPLIEINPSVQGFKPNQGFFIAWEFPVEL